MSPSKARANEVEEMLATNNIVLFRSPATWTRKTRHGTKIYEQWPGPKKRARVNKLLKWDRECLEQIYKTSNIALSDINRNQKLVRSPRSPYAGVASGLLKIPRTQLKKQTKMKQH